MDFDAPLQEDESHIPQLPMTPLIDVVFLLIVFFLTVKYAEEQGALAARLPRVEGVTPRLELREKNVSPEIWIKVRRAASGVAVEAGEVEPLSIEMNAKSVRSYQDLNFQVALLLEQIKQSGEKPFVVLDLGGDILYQSAVSAVNAVKGAGVEDVNFTPPDSTLSR